MDKNIQNPGSALGEAIGAEMEKSLNLFFMSICEEIGCHFITTGQYNKGTGKNRKLLMYDNFKNSYNIDSVIANESMQPLILIESKYIRYKKHNRDKGSWVCTAHSSIKKRYSSIRSSIAILAGNWSKTSIAMLESHDINIFLIPFNSICKILEDYKIKFDWDEKDRNQAIESWNLYCNLSPDDKLNIGKRMITDIAPDLKRMVISILDDSTPRDLKKILVEVHSTLGEVRFYEFTKLEHAIDFLQKFDFTLMLDTKNSPTLFDAGNGLSEDE